ncbi:HEAT repeat domain-containing protein [Sphaerisporangium fuscum]|uniref:HEAT repeat domain-containing protein n=1 Tax=Sphaerisporangium fuscum TaxID=2835868 RepID=UPI001BDC0663|nr:HEAT repeat domain-containing protein [Sphaerisporangium fuscum]
MSRLRDLFRRPAGRREADGERVLDSMRRLVERSARGGRHTFDELARVAFTAVVDDELADRALDTLAGAGPGLWIALDPGIRPWAYGFAGDPHVERAATVLGMRTPLAVALAACVRNGRDRERAVRHPLMRADARLLPVLVIRGTDWADQVREAALRVLAEVLADPGPAALTAAVPVAVRLGDRARAEPVTGMIRDALLRASDDTLDEVRRCGDRRARRQVYEVLLPAGRLDTSRLLTAALHDPDVVVQTRCAGALAAKALAGGGSETPGDHRSGVGEVSEDQAPVPGESGGRARPPGRVRDWTAPLEELLQRGSAGVRTEALTALVRLGHAEPALGFLADPASRVRLTAQWGVRRGGGDPAEPYRRRLSASTTGSPVRGARELLAGLGDCGGREDAALVRPYLRDPRPRVRAEAVRTLLRLGDTAGLAVLLEDPAPVVVRNVVEALRGSDERFPTRRLRALLAPGRPRHVRLAAYRLLRERDAWTRVEADLLLVTDQDETLKDRARTDLATWFAKDAARQFMRGPDRVRGDLEALLPGAEPIVGAETVRLLRLLVRGAGRRAAT